MGNRRAAHCFYNCAHANFKKLHSLKKHNKSLQKTIFKMKTAEIKITVELDDNNVPENLLWESTDAETQDKVPVKSMMLALWDHNYKNSMRIDLWTKDMPVDEMKRFFYETLQTMGDSFLKATGEALIIEDLRDYCAHFADKMGIDTRK